MNKSDEARMQMFYEKLCKIFGADPNGSGHITFINEKDDYYSIPLRHYKRFNHEQGSSFLKKRRQWIYNHLSHIERRKYQS